MESSGDGSTEVGGGGRGRERLRGDMVLVLLRGESALLSHVTNTLGTRGRGGHPTIDTDHALTPRPGGGTPTGPGLRRAPPSRGATTSTT